MPATAPIETSTGEYLLLEALLPGRPAETIGVLLLDPREDYLHIRLRRDWLEFANEDEYEVLRDVAADLQREADHTGGSAILHWMEETLSNTFRVTARETVLVQDFSKTLARLYRQHVPARPLRFETHLPLYSVVPAAGNFGERGVAEEKDLIEIPEDLALTEQMFVVRVSGHSMEPLIQDGQLCVFRLNVTGSRNGRRVLVEEGDERYTVKVYRSRKTVTEDSYQHEHIRLEPLNPAYDDISLTEDSNVRVVAEFVRALDLE